MTEKQFLEKVHRRVAQTCIGSSAIRNQGAGGLIDCMRYYFEHNIDIRRFMVAVEEERKYQAFLNHHTDKVLNLFPRNAQRWGAARKGLNLFFRDVTYNQFLAQYYGIPRGFKRYNQFVQHLEVPLDKEVGLRIRRDSGGMAPRWISIKTLTPNISENYQSYALRIAKDLGVARVNLDLIYWREAEK